MVRVRVISAKGLHINPVYRPSLHVKVELRQGHSLGRNGPLIDQVKTKAFVANYGIIDWNEEWIFRVDPNLKHAFIFLLSRERIAANSDQFDGDYGTVEIPLNDDSTFSPKTYQLKEDKPKLPIKFNRTQGKLSIDLGYLQITEKMELNFDQYTKGRKLGEGTYGVVNEYSFNGHSIAVKRVKNLQTLAKARLIEEINAMQKVAGHPNILRYFHHQFIEPHKLLIFMELCDGDLSKLAQENTLTDDDKLNAISQVVY